MIIKLVNHYVGNGEYVNRYYHPGDTFTWTGRYDYSHGCEDEATFRLREDGEWEVIATQACHSCWQVGHDSNHGCGFKVGDIIADPPTDLA